LKLAGSSELVTLDDPLKVPDTYPEGRDLNQPLPCKTMLLSLA